LATHVSALKRARKSKRRELRNTAVESAFKTSAKKVLIAAEEKNLPAAKEALIKAISLIHKASSKKVIPKKTAARKISQLTKKVNALASKNI